MKYYKCDICGKRFDVSDYEAITLILSVYDSNHPAGLHNPMRFDICPKHLDKIHKLLKLDACGRRIK